MSVEATDGKSRLLLVEDDVDIAEMLSILLSGHGYQIETAGDGAEALARLRAGNPPRAIVLDLMMPRMNGWEFRREQLRDPQLADIPVLVMTGVRDPNTQAKRLGVNAVVAKPIDLDELVSAIARVIR